jgi:hypothetical protein
MVKPRVRASSPPSNEKSPRSKDRGLYVPRKYGALAPYATSRSFWASPSDWSFFKLWFSI